MVLRMVGLVLLILSLPACVASALPFSIWTMGNIRGYGSCHGSHANAS